ncbi:MAG TPA: tRNA lysidine(34) synthetase TilS [Cyclobacteriaceae bacterium]
MLEQFLNHIQQHALCQSNNKIMLAVSGGVDSVVMLHLFKEAGFSIGVAHCNFQLRGKDSDEDENFVQQLCRELHVPVFVKRFDTQAYAWENRLSTQMAARELRYSWFDHLLDEQQYHFLATGHHFDDTVETILLNWIKGSSMEGLTGIPVKNKRIIRPLLFATRAQVEKYAHEKGIQWREDQSNLTDDYQRNFIRHQIIPKLKELNPSLETTLHTGIEKLQNDIELIHFQVEAWKKEFIVVENEKTAIAKKGFDSFPQGVHLLWRCIKEHGFNFEQAREIIHGLHGQSGKRFLSPTHQLVIDREHLILSLHEKFWDEITIQQDQTSAVLGSWEMGIEKMNSVEISKDSLIAKLDADKLKFPLRWRKWKAGDFFYPLGMEHKRKLSDFLIDNKVSVADKNVVTVLESAGEIAWVVGYRIDNRFKITAQTRSVLSFSIVPYFV